MFAALSVFPLWHVTLTAVIAAGLSLVLLRWRFKDLSAREAVLVSSVVGVSVLAWRLVGNVAQLNDDPIPPFSPNDLLCPVATYVCLGLYAAFRHPSDAARWELVRAWLTVISLVVNVVMI